jgi:SAM-dependent methyltransferase
MDHSPVPKPCDEGTTAGIHGPRWGARAEDWARFTAPASAPAWEAVADAAGVGPGARLLDVGCGSGEFCALAVARGARVSGIDAAEGMIAVARRAVPDADLCVGPLEALPWDDGSFDVATAFNALQFAEDVGGALAEVARVVRPGGVVAVCNWGRPEESELFALMGAVASLWPTPSSGPSRSRGPATGEPGVLEDLARAAGLEPERAGDVAVPFEPPDAEALARGLLAPGAVAVAITHSGERAVREAIVAAAERYRRPDGSYLIRNRFRYVVARAPVGSVERRSSPVHTG